MKTVFSLLLVAIASGCGPGSPGNDDPYDATRTEEIQGGKKDAKDPAVGLVWIEGGGFCSGTLVAPDVVLTAGHCVESPVASFYTGEGKGAHDVGPLPTGGGLTAHVVVDQIAHPSYRSRNQCPNPTFDVALLRLARPVAKIAPLPIADTPPQVGSTCRAVGYGVHNDGAVVTVEQRRTATEQVLKVSHSAVHVAWKTGVVDHGDSGGPLLCSGQIAGVTSCGDDGDGPDHRSAWYGRVDDVGAWIRSVIDDWGG
jgi:secreted trypsin-like serine protease